MAVTAETRNAIIELVVTAYDAAPGTTLLTDLVNQADGGASLADIAATLTTSSTFTDLYPTFLTVDEFAEQFLAALVPSVDSASDAYAEGKAAIEFVLNSGGTRADVILQAQTFLSGLSEDDASFGEPAAAFNNKVEVANYYTVTKEQDGSLADRQGVIDSITSDDSTVTTAQSSIDNTATTGQTFTLTDKADSLEGTAQDDTFVAATNRLSTNDSLDGKGGTDSLNTTHSLTADTTVSPILTSIENVSLNARDDGNSRTLTFDMADANDLQMLSLTRGGTNFTTALNNLNGSTKLDINDYKGTVNISLEDASGTADSLAVTATKLGSLVGTTVTRVTIDSKSDVESLALTSAGSATNYLTLTDSDPDIATLTVDGAADLNLSTSASKLTKLDLSASTAAKNTVTLSGSSNVSVTGSAGADTLNFGTTLTTLDTIDGGEGTDTVSLSMGSGVVSPALTGIEAVSLTLTTAGASGIFGGANSGALAMTVNASAASNVDLNDLASGSSVDLDDNDIATVAIDTAKDGTLDVSIGDSKTAVTTGAVTITDAQTVNITSDGKGANTFGGVALDDADTDVVTIATSGANLTTGNFTTSSKVNSLSITSTEDGSVTVGTFAEGEALATLNITAAGDDSGDVTIGAIGGDATKLENVTMTATDGADITFGNITGGNAGANIAQFSISASDGSVITDGVIQANTIGLLSLSGKGTITLDAAHDVGQITEVNASGTSGTVVIDLTASGDTAGGVIRLGTGTNTLTSSQGADTIVLSSGGTDTVQFQDSESNGKDTIQNFKSGTDTLNITDDDTDDGEVQITAAAVAGALTDNNTIVIEQDIGAAASLTTGGTATLADSDFTAGTLTNLSAFIDERFTVAANDAVTFVVNNGTNTYIYKYANDGDIAFAAAEFTLIGTVEDTVLKAADVGQVV